MREKSSAVNLKLPVAYYFYFLMTSMAVDPRPTTSASMKIDRRDNNAMSNFAFNQSRQCITIVKRSNVIRNIEIEMESLRKLVAT